MKIKMKSIDNRNAIVMAGIEKLANAVKTTLGPRGRNVVFDQKFDVPLVTNDGVTIAKQIEFDDPYENIGAQILKQASIVTNDSAGDGTTTSIILAHSILKEGLKNIASGANPIIMKKGIDKAADAVVSYLTKFAVPVKDLETIRYIATISGNNDEKIGELVESAFEKIGFNGVVLIEDSQKMETVLSYSEGIRIDKGYLSEHFINNQVNRRVEFDNPYILLVDNKIKEFSSILKILGEVARTERPLLIISPETVGEALVALAVNASKGNLRVAAISALGYGDTRKRNLEALALMLDATVVTEERGLKLKDCGLEVCGNARRVVVDKEQTVIQNPPGAGSEKANEMIAKVRKLLIETKEEYEIETLNITLSILTGGIVIIKVGGISELEMFERKYRMEDAIHAVYCAIESGILPGGGKALLEVIHQVKGLIETLDGDEKIGAMIVCQALKAPLMQIAQNAGIEGEVVVNNILSSGDPNLGFNALNLKYENMFDAGIIDPAKVVISAFTSATSVATMLLTMESSILGKL
ncbi:MAG: Hsp60 family chaperonin [Eubacteriales bacterium]